jgi:capsular polysaccharide transport system permease protein
MMVLFSFMRDRVVPGVSFALFLMTGVVGFHFFQHAASRSIDAISANAALFSYRQVRPVDTVLVRAALEAFIEFIVFVLLIAGASFLDMDAIPADPAGVLVALLLLAGFGTGLGLIFSVGADLVPEIGKVLKLAFTPLYFISGVMFIPAVLPANVRAWLFLNPAAHGLEALREAFFDAYPRAPELDLGYLFVWTMVTVFLGLALHIRFAQRILAR